MDPNVQVAIAATIGTTITTLGVVIVALINARKTKSLPTVSDPVKDSDDPLELLRSLVMENARKEATIIRLRKKVSELEIPIPEESHEPG